MEGAGQVLAGGQVHGRLASHGSVNLGQERGRAVNDGDASLEQGSRQAAQVAHRPAAEGDEQAVALQAGRGQEVQGRLQSSHCLALLAGRQRENGSLHQGAKGRAMELPHGFVAEDHNTLVGCELVLNFAQQITAHMHKGGGLQGYCDGRAIHGTPGRQAFW